MELNQALDRLAKVDQQKSSLIELHYFGGLSYEESAEVLSISPATVHRELKLAKAWLRTDSTVLAMLVRGMHPEAERTTRRELTTAGWARIQELFYGAADLPPGDRAGFLAAACPDSQALRIQVEKLLASLEEDGGITSRVQQAAASALAGAGPAAGDRIGAYEIVRLIGHGGMGAVYLAARADDQFRKQVAIKTLRVGAADPELLRRFRAERQILANLEHPNIARLLDGGVTDAGLPYLAMEFVEGVPLDKYAAAHALSLEDRIRLFGEICGAVQFSHQNLVVHRDLKPANILVTASGKPVLLDFGIAKLLGPGLTGTDAGLTLTSDRLLTPAYASPEQIRGGTITTATDVYSLGVVLYELLTGRRPFELEGLTPAEQERLVFESAPARPSTGPEHKRLRGDLDNVVMKAMHPDPLRRYISAGALAEDLDRFLAGFPVAAKPDTVAYRTRKFVARHKFAVAAAAVFLVAISALSASLAITSATARREARTADEVSKFMVGLFRINSAGLLGFS